jgi:hypothetical protein
LLIVEANIKSKTGDPATCEDRYCLTEHYACVIDGATDVSGKRYRSQTSGQVISTALEEGIRSLPPSAEIDQIMDILDQRLMQTYHDLDMYDAIMENPFSRPSASMVLFSHLNHKIWMIGDCQCMIDGKLYTNEKIVDSITANARSMFLESELLKGKTIEELLERDTASEVIRPFLQAQYYMQNAKSHTQYGYIALTGFDFDRNQIKTIDVQPDAEILIMASDGYPRLMPTLMESEAELQIILDTDPLCFRTFKLAKGLQTGNSSFDDRTYIKIELS